MDTRAYLGLAPDWYRDGADASVIRYWDGASIAAEQHWTGEAWEEWWLASDGHFYPPSLHPSAAVPAASPPYLSTHLSTQGELRVGRSGSEAVAAVKPTRHHRRRRLVPVAVLGAAAVVATAAVALGAGGQQNAEALVVGAVNSTLADKTADTTLTLDVAADGSDVTASGTGAVDFTQNAMNMDVSMGLGGNEVDMQMVYLGGTMYEAIPGLDQLEPGKTWVSMDLSSLTAGRGASGNDSLGLEGNPTEMLRVLAQQGNKAVPIGTSDVDGVPVQGYSVTIDAAAMKSQLAHANLPGWMQQEMSHLSGDVTFKVYVDTEGRLCRTAIDMAMDADGTKVDMTESLDFSGYGTPVSISAPPADQVVDFQQFLQDAAQSSANS